MNLKRQNNSMDLYMFANCDEAILALPFFTHLQFLVGGLLLLPLLESFEDVALGRHLIFFDLG